MGFLFKVVRSIAAAPAAFALRAMVIISARDGRSGMGPDPVDR
jgi:hypothetical protein